MALLDAISLFDVGQAVIVADACVLATEASEGTDQMLARGRASTQRRRWGAGRGVLVKAAGAIRIDG
jgi:DUF1009 family protein